MAALSLDIRSIPRLNGKTVLLTGTRETYMALLYNLPLYNLSIFLGRSLVIGLAAAPVFASKGARVHVLDWVPIDWGFNVFETPGLSSKSNECQIGMTPEDSTTFHSSDVTDWEQLRSLFDQIPRVDIYRQRRRFRRTELLC